MHRKIFEDAGPPNADRSPMPTNQHNLIELNYDRYSDQNIPNYVT